MKICNYGITLNRLRKEDLEFVLQKFKETEVLNSAESGIYSSAEMQLQWFESIDTFENFYSIIEYKGDRLGMLNTRNIDWTARTSESSLFLWDKSLTDSLVPVLASVCMLEAAFYYLNWKACYIRLHNSNRKALETALNLGYERINDEEDGETQKYYLTRKLFEANSKKLLAKAREFFENESGEGFLLLEPLDYESGIAQKIEKYMSEAGIYLHRRGLKGSRKYSR